MKHQIALFTIIFSVFVAGVCTADITGDWLLKGDFGGRPFDSILSLSKNEEGVLRGYMINNWMMTDLKNVKYESDTLTFSQEFNSMNGPAELTFKGTIKDGTLSGTISGERGDFPMSGKKIPVVPVLGKWQFKRQRQGQEIVSTLTVTADEEGKLSAVWASPRGESEMSDVTYTDGKLTFKRIFDRNGQTTELSYQLGVEDGKLKGTMTSQQGPRNLEGEFAGPAITGKWVLTRNFEFGESKQMLVIYPDLSARYGTTKIKKIDYDTAANTVAFKYSLSFGDRTFENEFSGKLDGKTLTGKMNNARGVTQVSGKKL